MMTLKVKDNEYKIKFGFNSFCDNDLIDRVKTVLSILSGKNIENDEDIKCFDTIKELFSCVRELLFVGFKKYNPVNSLQEVGDILDDYKDEETEENKKSLFVLFMDLVHELMEIGFFGEVMEVFTKTIEETAINSKKAK